MFTSVLIVTLLESSIVLGRNLYIVDFPYGHSLKACGDGESLYVPELNICVRAYKSSCENFGYSNNDNSIEQKFSDSENNNDANGNGNNEFRNDERDDEEKKLDYYDYDDGGYDAGFDDDNDDYYYYDDGNDINNDNPGNSENATSYRITAMHANYSNKDSKSFSSAFKDREMEGISYESPDGGTCLGRMLSIIVLAIK